MDLQKIWTGFLDDKFRSINRQLPRLRFCLRMMTVVDNEQLAAVRGTSETMVSSPTRVSCRLHDRIEMALFPWPKRTCGGRIAHRVLRTFKMAARIGQVIMTIVLQHLGALDDIATVLFPRLIRYDHPLQ